MSRTALVPARGMTASHANQLVLLAYLAVGAAGLFLYLTAAEPVSAGGYLLVSFLPIPALLLGPRLHAARSHWPWLFLALGFAAFFVGDLIWYADAAASRETFPTIADLPYLAGYPALAIGLYMFVRHHGPRNRLTPIIDALSVGIVGALLLWLVLIQSFIYSDALAFHVKLALMAYPLGDVLLLAAAAYVVLATPVGRVAAARLLLAAMAALLVADVLYTDMLVELGYQRGWADALWLASYLLVGLAALVPSMGRLTEDIHPDTPRDTRWRLFVPALALVFVPLFGFGQHLLYGRVDLDVIVVTEVVLGALLLLRLYDMSKAALVEQRRYTAILASSSDGVSVIGDDRTITHSIRPAGLESTGGVKTARIGMPLADAIREIVHPDDRQPCARLLNRVMGSPGSSATGELRLRMDDMTFRWFRYTATNRPSKGKTRETVVTYHDITAERAAADNLRHQAQILGNIREAVIVTDMGGLVTYWNAGAEDVYGYTADEMAGSPISAIYSKAPELLPDDLARIIDGEEYRGGFEGLRKDGSAIVVDAHTRVMTDDSGEPIGFVGISRDVTAERAVERRNERLGAAIEQGSEAVVIADRQGNIEYVNPAFERITGYARDEVIGRNPRFLQSGQHPPAFYRTMWATLTSGETWVANFINHRRDGTTYEAWTVITPILDLKGEMSGFVAVSRDVTAERRAELHTERMARERTLVAQTLRGLDRRAAPEATAQAISRQMVSLSDIESAGLFIFHSDGTAVPYGFAVAGRPDARVPRLPRQRTAYLRERAESGPWIAEWQDRPDHPYNELFLDLGIRAIAYAPVRDGDEVIGFLQLITSAENAGEVLSLSLPALLEFADICGAQLGHAVTVRMRSATARAQIAKIIRRHAFTTVFQPIVDIERGTVPGYEALTRFSDGVAPDIHMAAAARSGLEVELDLAMLRRSLEAALSLPDGAWLNVNVSPATVHDRRLAKLLTGYDRRLVLEVTEHAAISDYDAFRAAAQQLGSNVRLAVDDAGAGFASMRHILELRPAMVKLDRAMISGLESDAAKRGLVAGVCHFAATSDIMLVAEGVETEAELTELRALGVGLAQGYLLGRPAPVSDGLDLEALRARYRRPQSGPASSRPVAVAARAAK